jgi:uncharacterized protein (TIGR03382 family)
MRGPSRWVGAAGALVAAACTPTPGTPGQDPGQERYDLAGDPSLLWARYWGGSASDVISGAATNASGDIWVAGKTRSKNFPKTHQFGPASGLATAFAARFSSRGQPVYSVVFGGSAAEGASAIAVDSAGNAFVTGGTSSYDFPTTPGAYLSDAGVYDGGAASAFAFVTEISPMGDALVYSTLCCAGSESGSAIAIDATGSAVIAGVTTSAQLPTTPGAFQRDAGGGSNFDAFVARFSPSGSALIYCTYLAGSGLDSATGVALDSSGDAYITGQTGSTDFPTLQPLQASLAGTGNAFVTELGPSGNGLFSTYLGGDGGDEGSSIAVDSAGSAVVAGTTTSPSFPVRSAFQPTIKGNQNGFVLRLAPGGTSLVYSTFLGGSGADGAASVALDQAGNAWVASAADSPDFPLIRPLFPALDSGVQFGAVTEFSPSGAALFSTALPGSRGSTPGSIAVASATLFIAGSTVSTDLPVGSLDSGYSGGPGDGFVIAFTAPDGGSFGTSDGGSAGDGGSAAASDGGGGSIADGGSRAADGAVTDGGTQHLGPAGYDVGCACTNVGPGAILGLLLTVFSVSRRRGARASAGRSQGASGPA